MGKERESSNLARVLFVCFSLTTYGSQRVRLPISLMTSLPSFLWSRWIFTYFFTHSHSPRLFVATGPEESVSHLAKSRLVCAVQL